MSEELIAINQILHVTRLLANLVISNDFIEQAKMAFAHIVDKELTKFIEKLTNIKVYDLSVARF